MKQEAIDELLGDYYAAQGERMDFKATILYESKGIPQYNPNNWKEVCIVEEKHILVEIKVLVYHQFQEEYKKSISVQKKYVQITYYQTIKGDAIIPLFVNIKEFRSMEGFD